MAERNVVIPIVYLLVLLELFDSFICRVFLIPVLGIYNYYLIVLKLSIPLHVAPNF